MENQYGTMTLVELKNIAKEKGIQGYSAKKKQELVDLLSALEAEPKESPKLDTRKKEKAIEEAEDTSKKEKAFAEGKDTSKKKGKEESGTPKKKDATEKKAKQAGTNTESSEHIENAKSPKSRSNPEPEGKKGSAGHEEAPVRKEKEIREAAPIKKDVIESRDGQEKEGILQRREVPAKENAGRREAERRDYPERPRYERRENQERREARDSHARQNYGRQGQERNYQNSYPNNNYPNSNYQSNNYQNSSYPNNNQTSSQNSNQNNTQNTNLNSTQNSAANNGQNNAPNNPNMAQSVYQPAQEATTAQGQYRPQQLSQNDMEQLDSGETKEGILEVMPEGFGFIRCDNFLPGDNDVYVAPMQIRRMNLKTGDIIVGNTKIRSEKEKFSALLYVKQVNGMPPAEALKRPKFEDLTPIFPNSRIHLETPGCKPAMRMVDLISPIGKGQRGMIVSQPKAGKTTLLKQIAKAVNRNHPEMHMIILLIDERPEEVTDMKESIQGSNVEVIYSTFDELPENHKRVSEMVIERAKRLVEHGKDVIILLDSITRLARAYNLTVQASGRTLSGGLDPAALHMPKKFFGAARNMREGGSLTILATALVETGSRMDDVVFEEFKGTGNMELVLDRNLSERRVFPAIDLPRSSTRRDDLLLRQAEMEANMLMRRAFNGMKSEDAVERIIQMFAQTKSNAEFIEQIKKTKLAY